MKLDELQLIRRRNLGITRAQFGEMLIRKGIKTPVEAAIAAIPDATERAIVQEWYEHTPDVQRLHPKVESLRQALGISVEDSDAWFTEAKSY